MLMRPPGSMPTVDFVIPLYNEQAGLIRFHEMLDATSLPLGCERRYIYVNDGSDDETPVILNELASKDSRISVIHLEPLSFRIGLLLSAVCICVIAVMFRYR
jgi:polyisoprenyl-phosphate glycosyltransferase